MLNNKIDSSYFFPVAWLIASLVPVIPMYMDWENGQEGYIKNWLPFLIMSLTLPIYGFLIYYKRFILSDTELIIQYPFNKWKQDINIPLKSIIEIKFGQAKGSWMTFTYSTSKTEEIDKKMFVFDIKNQDLRSVLLYFKKHEINVIGKDVKTVIDNL